MITPTLTGAHLGILVVSVAGFLALALATERQAEHLLGRLPALRSRRLARMAGWILLSTSLAWAIGVLGLGVGITLWLGWLSIAALSWVFILPRWHPRPRAPHPARAPKLEELMPPAPGHHAHRWVGGALLVSTIVLFLMGLARVESKALKGPGALQGKAGPWTFTLAEARREPPEVMEMDVPMKEFRVRFCESCDNEIRQAYLKVNKPRSANASGMGFVGQRWERRVEIPLPSTTQAGSELWLTVVGKDGRVHHSAWPMEQVAPTTVIWFERQRRAHAAN